MERLTTSVPMVEEGTLVYEDRGQPVMASVGTPRWFAWLEDASTFTFTGVEGTFTAHKARAGSGRGSWYWRAYRGHKGRTFTTYLGVSANLTLFRLQEAARRLALPTLDSSNRKTLRSGSRETQTASQTTIAVPLPMVRTKSAVPRLPLAHVPRTRLVALLEESATHPLTLVSAPAGSGKTTLLAEWVRATTMPVAWLSLEPADGDLARFLAYLLAALRGLDARIGTVPDLEAEYSSEKILAQLCNDLDDFLSTDAALVLDDYQVLESEAVDTALHFLLEHLPQRLHLVLGTRVDPAFPLARLRARGQLGELRADSLRFVPIEVEFFLHQMEVDLDQEALLRLEERTEGWIAGLQLAALALRGRGDHEAFLRSFRGTHQLFLEYLDEEILARVRPQLRAFLLQTSIVEHLCGSLCDAVTAGSGSQAILEELRRANLFVTALDEMGSWYRYHPLFAEGLTHLLRQNEPERFQELCARASAWYEAHEMPFEACEYALQAGDLARAVPLIERQVGALIGHAQLAVLQRWLSQVPSDLIAGSPLLSVASTLERFVDGALRTLEVENHQSERLQQSPAAFLQHFPARTNEADHAKWIEARAQLSFMLVLQAIDVNDAARGLAIARQTLDDLPEDAGLLRALASLCLDLAQGMVCRRRGDFVAAERALIEATTRVHATNYHYLNLVALGTLTEIYEAQGELRKSERMSQRFLHLFGSRKDLPPELVSGIRLSYAGLLVEWNRFEEAEETLRQILSAWENSTLPGESVPSRVFTLDGHYLQMRVAQARGQYAEALAWLQEIEKELADMPPAHPMVGLPVSARARLLLAQGKVDEAALWFSQRGLSYDDPFSDDPLQESPAESEIHFTEYMTLARLLIAQGRASPRGASLTQALTMLDRLRVISEKAGLTRRVIEILMLTALDLQAAGETPTALANLDRAVALAEPGGFVRLFADEGEPMARLLTRLPTHKSNSASYLRMLLEAAESRHGSEPHGMPGEPHQKSIALLDPLTPREIEVLSLLAKGASNPDIAAQLVITPNTAKRHVKHILAKLSSASRIQAVTRARELGLI
ncbi:MAG: LuxR C-terminal-related transcriptional regulator [Ktedonobacterales bacterium]